MNFFRRSGIHGSYNLFSAYSYYMPGVGGMFMLLLMLLIGAALGNIVTLLLQLAVPGDMAADYGMLVSYPLMFIPAMLYASAKSRSNEMFGEPVPLDSNNFASIGKGVAIAVIVSAMTLTAAMLCDPLTLLLPEMPEALKAVFENMMNGMPLWTTLLSVSVFAPFFEEWLCRGMVLRGLLGRMKPVWAITISALFFAAIHFNPWQVLPAIILGLLFGYVYYRTGSLKLTMLMHCVNNTFSVLLGRTAALKDVDFLYETVESPAYVCLLVGSAIVFVGSALLFTVVRKNYSGGDFHRTETL